MPLTGGYAVITTTPIPLSDFLPAGAFKQIDFFAPDTNAGTVYIGPADIESDGENAYQAIGAGRSWGHGVKGAGEQMEFDFSTLYVHGTEDDKFLVSIVK